MYRSHLAFLSSVLLWCLPVLRAQDPAVEQFRLEFNKGIELNDEKLVDKALKKAPFQALTYYEGLYWEKDKGNEEALAKCNAIGASWKRTFENSETIDKFDRWLSGTSNSDREQYQKRKSAVTQLWGNYIEFVKEPKRADFERLLQQMMDVARQAESSGNNLEIAEIWNLVSVIASKMPDKTLGDRRDGVFAIEQFLNARKAWSFAFDEHYLRNNEFAKAEKVSIADAEKETEKRKTEGYDANAKGVEALVMPNSVEAKHELKFEPLTNLDELDYGPKTGVVAPFWWMVTTEKVGSSRELGWFARKKLHLLRTGAAKWAIGFDPGDKNAVEVEVSPKAKISTFWLDPEKKQPHALAFWIGSDREMVNEAECNLAASDTIANVYYRSASSWHTLLGADAVVLYDDNASGHPGDVASTEVSFKVFSLGDYEEGTVVPLFDSMRVGKGPRVPYSEFVKLSTGWHHVKKAANDVLGVRPLNPEYVKTGKVKLVWTGPKPTAPVQLVVQGGGDYKTALFDVAGGKEVELPAAEYNVLWGRLAIGKGARVQQASLYPGTSKPFKVEAGKVFELKMGGPFTLTFNRRGDENANLDAMKVLLTESSGCVLTDLHGINLACEVFAAKEPDGKGAKATGAKFGRFTDPEIVIKAANKRINLGMHIACFPLPEGDREGDMNLKVKLPAAGMKVGLQIKKHPLFGDVKSAWQ